MNDILAKVVDLSPDGGLEGIGPLATPGSAGGAISLLTKVISNLIGLATIIAGLWFVFQFLLGAIGWLSSGGDKVKVESAQKKLTQGIIGLVIVVAAIFLVDLIGTLLGLNILSPGEIILGFWK